MNAARRACLARSAGSLIVHQAVNIVGYRCEGLVPVLAVAAANTQ